MKTYPTTTGQVNALRGVDYTFAKNAVSAVVGPSGSGKSTLLRLLAGLDTPTSGVVRIEGRELESLSARDFRALRRNVVAYIFQRPAENLVSYLTVDEHLRLAARVARDGARSPEELLDTLELRDRRHHLPGALSGGEQQRAALAFALAAGPRLVLADEPTAELDDVSARQLLRIVRELVSSGVSFILATHDMDVVRVADDVLELEHGRTKPRSRTGFEPLAPPPDQRAAKAGEPVVVAEQLRKTYAQGGKRLTVLDDVSLVLHRGRLASVFGRSGSGKTTLLNVLFGWENPDSGALWRLGDDERAGSEPGWHELALVPQKFGLIDELTVRENVEYPSRLARRLAEDRAGIEALLMELALQPLADRFPAEISVGEQQRVALARALAVVPRILLADEPSGHQDATSARQVLAAMRAATSAGTSGLVATHNEALAPQLDMAYRMQGGRLIPVA